MRDLRIPPYPHFDGPLSQASARALVTNPDRVAMHAFSPFLRRRALKRKFRSATLQSSQSHNPRMITYAGRRDSVIFRHYRDILYERYEEILRIEGLRDCILAYRSIASPEGHSKSNIDFAVEAFDAIRRAGDCTVFCLDIKSFFDNIAHQNVSSTWKELLGSDPLPNDHYAVMKAATKYSFIEEKAALGILGYFGIKQSPSSGPVRGFLMPRRSLPTRLCDRKEFREKIAKNVTVSEYGIPQGLPISDVLANAVLLRFDLQMKQQCDAMGGLYRRYSDDLLFILPSRSVDPSAWIQGIDEELQLTGERLKLGRDKSAAYTVDRLDDGQQRITPIQNYKSIPTIDYLGLSYDGSSIFLRQSTLARLKRRIVFRVRRQVLARFRESPAATANEIVARLHLEGIMREFGRIEVSHRKGRPSSGRGPWRSFRCYAVRASRAYGFDVSQILKQISGLNDFVRSRAKREISKLRP